METLKSINRYNKLFDEYKHKSMEIKHKSIKKPKLRNNVLQNEINRLRKKLNKLNEIKMNNPILINMLITLQKYGYNENIAKKYINDIDKLIDDEIKNKNGEIYFINIINKIKKIDYSLLSLIYSNIKEYFNFKRSINFN